jgi:hypothetical protein
MEFTTTKEEEMFRIEFLVEDANGSRGVFTATALNINDAKSLVDSDLRIVKTLCMIDLQPQKALAF